MIDVLNQIYARSLTIMRWADCAASLLPGSGSGFGRPQAHAQFKLGSPQAQGHRAFRAPRTTGELDSKASDFASRQTTARLHRGGDPAKEVVTRTDGTATLPALFNRRKGQNLPRCLSCASEIAGSADRRKVQVTRPGLGHGRPMPKSTARLKALPRKTR